MMRDIPFGPALADGAGFRAGERFSVSPPDEQGNRFITVLGDDGAPVPAREPTDYDREGA